MPYSKSITRLSPTAFVILIDRSGSMSEKIVYDGIEMSKAEAVAGATNMLIDEMINRCRRLAGVYDYYNIAVLGYSGDGVYNLLSDDGFTTPSRLAARGAAVETVTRERRLADGSSVLITVNRNRWIEPAAFGKTPMYEALHTALSMIDRWSASASMHSCYPPTVFNITDGEATDADDVQLTAVADKIKNVSTSDGNALLMNINMAVAGNSKSVVFPSDISELPDCNYARLLYQMASPMPDTFNDLILAERGGTGEPPFRAMSLNAQMSDVVSMLNIGSFSSTF